MTTTSDTSRGARLLHQAHRFVQSGRFGAAKAVLAAVRRTAPGDLEASVTFEIDEIDARIAIAEGQLPQAAAMLDRAIAQYPGRGSLHMLRAEVRAHTDDMPGAVADAADAVILTPGDARPKAMLGLMMIEIGELADAIACLREATRDAPDLAAAWRGLAEAHGRAGDHAAAAEVLRAAIARAPHDTGLRVAAMMAAMRRRDFTDVIVHGQSARGDGVADACALGLLGHALSQSNRHQEAAEAYQDALRLAPEDPYVRHLVRAAGLLPDSEQAPAEYLETVFDGYAERFEQHLIGLGYRVPGLIRQAAQAILRSGGTNRLGDVLDLGCGTGLAGIMLADLPSDSLVGVDVSANMLAQARDKGIYTRLEQGEIGAFLAGATERWDLVVAADVFCYFGDLERILGAVRRHLPMGGHIVFTIELRPETAPYAAPDPGWRLGAQGRYSHRHDYVTHSIAAAGLELVATAAEVLRFEGGAEVAGLLVTATKVASDA